MRIFVAGASGAIGTHLVPQLVAAGHEVIGTHQSPDKAELVRGLGARPVQLDLLDPAAVRRAVAAAEPEAIIHQATAISGARFGRKLDKPFAVTNRLRTAGTDALLAAAWEVGVRRFIAQSFAPYRYAREGSMVKSEDDPLDPNPPRGMEETHAAMRHLDTAVIEAGGIVLRYGGFYGGADDGWSMLVRRRMLPIIGGGGGYMSFIHLGDAAAATVRALSYEGPRLYNIVDDEPAPAREWIPALADVLGAKRPWRFPRGFARLLAGEANVVNVTEARGASNAKAKRELSWTLRYPTWRQGFAAVYAAPRGAGERQDAATVVGGAGLRHTS